MPTPAIVQGVKLSEVCYAWRGRDLPKVTLGNLGGDRTKVELGLLSSGHFKPTLPPGTCSGVPAWAVGQGGQGQGCGDLFHISRPRPHLAVRPWHIFADPWKLCLISLLIL